MSSEERTGRRSLSYSRWHRPSSIRKYVGVLTAARLALIDIDGCEYCVLCRAPLALIETVRGRTPKGAPVTALLAKLARIEAYSVAYVLEATPECCPSCGQETTNPDIELFAVRQLQPPSEWVRAMSPQEYADFLCGLRDGHLCSVVRGA